MQVDLGITRICKKLVGHEFIDCNFDSLKKGDQFMLFEPDRIVVKDSHGNSVFTAASDPYFIDDVWGIRVNG